MSTEPGSATGTIAIDLSSGQLQAELNGSSPSSVYVFAFLSSSQTLQLGMLTTDLQGRGTLEASLSPGNYDGRFEVASLGTLQFISEEASFTIASTVTVTATETNSTTETSTATETQTTSTSATMQIEFQIEPAFRSIAAGAFAKFNIRVDRHGGTSNVLLVARGIPDNSVAIFTPNIGLANPTFHSTLTIVTAINTRPGTYAIVVSAVVDGQKYDAEVGLGIEASATSHTTTVIPPVASLSLTIGTDQHHYEQNATVTVEGHVRDNSGGAVAESSVSVQVDGPTGTEIVFVSTIRTDSAGLFHLEFTLSANATVGTYTVFASASKEGYASATTHTTFVVGVSSTPSVVIREVYVTDTAGSRSAVFTLGQTVVVWVVVENSGAAFEGVIWVQIRDPNGVPLAIQFHVSTLETGETVKEGFGFTLLTAPVLGLYTANALVSDKLISQGGTFFASADTQFALTG